MSGDDDVERAGLTADGAFGALGNLTRVEILQTLAAADDPLTFSTLRERVGTLDSGQFAYHLGKLDGHFVHKTEDGYRLSQHGRYLVEAILSGVFTESPRVEPTAVDFDCLFCGTSIEVSYEDGTVQLRCPECTFQRSEELADEGRPTGVLSAFAFPPAGVIGRSPAELQAAAATWVHLEAVALSSRVCPRCAAAVDLDITACPSHQSGDRLCETCGELRGVRLHYRCRNCIFEADLGAVMGLLAAPPLLAFIGDHGLNATSKGFQWGWDYGEEILATSPFEARFTFDIDDERLTLHVDDQLEVLSASRTSIDDGRVA
ncbi:MAG: hypothetical protein ABEJ35_07805 [Halobacteriaceae archaeon]